jgi:membrane-associated protein
MFEITDLLIKLGSVAIFFVIIIETGTPIGVFLPGDSLLFTTGVLAAKGYFNIWHILPLFFVGGIIGNELGYYLGKRFGVKLFDGRSKHFKKEHLIKTQEFINAYGAKAVVIGRFVPIVRTAIATVAGTGGMDRRLFSACNVLGSALWAIGLPFIGFQLGERVDNIELFILPIAGLIIVVSFIPVIREWLKHKKRKKAQRDDNATM